MGLTQTAVVVLLLGLFCSYSLGYSADQVRLAERVQDAIRNYADAINYFIEDPLRVADHSDAGVCVTRDHDIEHAVHSSADCVVNDYPAGTIPTDIVQAVLAATSYTVSMCDVPAPQNGMSGSLAVSLSGKDVSSLCPEGAVSSFSGSTVFTDTKAIYTVYTAVTNYDVGTVLAYANDADGPIVAAVANTPLPPGVTLNSTNGDLYVSNPNALSNGQPEISITTVDKLGHYSTLTVKLYINYDRCAKISNPCTSGYRCTNTATSYTCVDVNECVENAAACSAGTKCQNIVGSYFCFTSSNPLYYTGLQHYYQLITSLTPLTFAQANESASAMILADKQGYLVTLNDQWEQAFAKNNFFTPVGATTNVLHPYSWTGGLKTGSEWKWYALSRTSGVFQNSGCTAYCNWATGAPNNGGAGTCLQTQFTSSDATTGKWVVKDCSTVASYFIVEYDLPSGKCSTGYTYSSTPYPTCTKNS